MEYASITEEERGEREEKVLEADVMDTSVRLRNPERRRKRG